MCDKRASNEFSWYWWDLNGINIWLNEILGIKIIPWTWVMETHWVKPSHVNWVKELSESSTKGFQGEHYGILNLTDHSVSSALHSQHIDRSVSAMLVSGYLFSFDWFVQISLQLLKIPDSKMIRSHSPPEDERSFPQVQSQEVQAPVSPLLASPHHLQSHVRLMTHDKYTTNSSKQSACPRLWWDHEMGLQLKVPHGHRVPNELHTPRPQHLQFVASLNVSACFEYWSHLQSFESYCSSFHNQIVAIYHNISMSELPPDISR